MDTTGGGKYFADNADNYYTIHRRTEPVNEIQEQITELKRLRKQALHNARRQFRMAQGGVHVRVRHTFWEQVARDYLTQINELRNDIL